MRKEQGLLCAISSGDLRVRDICLVTCCMQKCSSKITGYLLN